jgi:hypothetical protein
MGPLFAAFLLFNFDLDLLLLLELLSILLEAIEFELFGIVSGLLHF